MDCLFGIETLHDLYTGQLPCPWTLWNSGNLSVYICNQKLSFPLETKRFLNTFRVHGSATFVYKLHMQKRAEIPETEAVAAQ